MILRVLFIPALWWKCALLKDPAPSWTVRDTKICEPEYKDLKTAHHKLPRWLHYSSYPRHEEDIVKRLGLQGRNLAGRTEFPWLVDLRDIPTEDWSRSKNWANGNLITGWYVLTTCEAVATFNLATGGGNAFDEDLGVANWYLQRKDPNNYRVMFASRYHYVETSASTKDEVGTREVDDFLPHPKCNFFVLDYSLGIVKIRHQAIWPFPPFTLYMHVDFDCVAFQKLKSYFNNPARKKEKEEDYCFVAMWSRRIQGDSEIVKHADAQELSGYQQIWDHKIKYPVRWVDPMVCKSVVGSFPIRMRHQEVDFFECMGLNETERVGVVCNQDQGAPIVCNGVVRAFVLAGAIDEHCGNERPLPFLVIDARFSYSMWTNINAHAFKMTGLRNPVQHSGVPSCFFPEMTTFLLTFYLISIMLDFRK